MPNESHGYQGWPSYETWLAYTWLSNDPLLDATCALLATDAASSLRPQVNWPTLSRSCCRSRHQDSLLTFSVPTRSDQAHLAEERCSNPASAVMKGDLALCRYSFTAGVAQRR